MSKYKLYKLNTNPSIKRNCSICRRAYPATAKQFKRNRSKALGLEYYCKRCDSERRKKIFFEVNTDSSVRRRCCACGKNYPATLQFYGRDKSIPMGLTYRCRWCRREITLKYRIRIGRERSRKWYWDNREKFLTYCYLRRKNAGFQSRLNHISTMHRLKGDNV